MSRSPIEGLDVPAVDALITGLVETRRAISRLQAFEASLMSAAVDVVATAAAVQGAHGDDDLPWREVSAEIATALKVSDRTMQSRLGEAAMLVDHFPATHAAWAAGEIDQARVRVILDAGATLPTPEVRAEYEKAVLTRAGELTAGRLGPVCRAAADRVHPESIDERHKRARKARNVRVSDLDDGMSRLLLDGPATLVHAIFDRVTQMAITVQEAGRQPTVEGATGASTEGEAPLASSDAPAGSTERSSDADPAPEERTLDQVRADVLTDMLLTAVPTGHGPADVFEKITAFVQVTVPAKVLEPAVPGAAPVPEVAETDPSHGRREPAFLAGSGPIDAETARILAAAAKGWDRIFTDPVTNLPLCVDRHDPSAHLTRFLRARDEHCRFPGCRQPVWRSDRDHTLDYVLGGRTSDDNLEHLCRRHHVVKHQTRWAVRQLSGGVLEWTSPTGRRYEDHPSPGVRFSCTDPPPF